MKVSIVIPAYNEEKRIARTLEGYGSYFNELVRKKALEYEILVVINNTTDRTEEIVKNLAKTNKKIRYINLKKGGKGYAVISGFQEAVKGDSDFIGFVDADMATPPEAFNYLIKEIKGYDGAIADRRLKESIIQPEQPFKRRFAAACFNLLVRTLFLFPYKDTQCGAKLFRKDVLKQMLPKLGMSGYAFDVEMLYVFHKLGGKMKQAKTIWKDMDYSKIDLKKHSIQMFFAVFQLRIINSPLRIILRPLKPLIMILWGWVK